MPVRNLRDTTLKIADSGGTGGANVITVGVEQGVLSWTERHPVDFISDRGTLHHARLGADVPIEFSLDIQFQTFLDPNSATETPYEAVRQQGAASGWSSDASNGGDAYAFILEATFNDPAGGTDEVITLTECYAEEIPFAEGEPANSLTISGRALLTAPTIT